MTDKYPCKVRKGLNIPWGYEEHPDDPSLFMPIEEHLDAYYEAVDLVKQGVSLRQAAKWLSAETENPITHVGLYLKMKQEEKKKRSRVAKAAWERKFGGKEEKEST